MFLRRFIRLNARLLSDWLRKLADEIHELVPGSPETGFIVFYGKEGAVMASIEVPADSAPLTARVRFLDAEGNETPADDIPQWSSTDESVATVEAGEDGMSATVSIGSPGAAVIEVKSVEANTGAEVIAQGTITAQPGDAVIGDVTFEEAPETPEGEGEGEPVPA